MLLNRGVKPTLINLLKEKHTRHA